MAGAPLAVADQYDTIGNNLSYYTNPEILALKKKDLLVSLFIIMALRLNRNIVDNLTLAAGTRSGGSGRPLKETG